MWDLVGNPEDRFSQIEAHMGKVAVVPAIQGVQCRMVLVVNFLVFLKLLIFTLLLLY